MLSIDFSDIGLITGIDVLKSADLQEKVLCGGKIYNEIAIDTCPKRVSILQTAIKCKQNVT